MNRPPANVAPKSDTVTRRRYERATRARQEAESLLDSKSRELWEANQKLQQQAENLEELVNARTQDLGVALQAARAASTAKSTFLASMSHEIRTPLNGVLGMAEALMDTPISAEQTKMLGIIADSGQMLMSVLNDILDISKIEAGQMEIEKAPVHLAKLFASLEQLYTPKAREKNLELALRMGAQVDQWILGDATRLRQVVGNLVSNAIKFTTAGSVQILVDLIQQGGGQFLLTIDVKDTGEGIPEDRLHRLFKPFSQVDSSIARKYGGTGLGLSISKQICDLLGGTISVHSTVGQGTQFSVTMPVHISAKPKETTKVLEGAISILNQQRWRILLAEDNRTNQIVFQKLLGAYDLDIVVVDNGAKAVQAYQDGAFDAVFMDINMPAVSGIEATQSIRQLEKTHKTPRVPICALTANTMKQQVEEYLSKGFDSHLGKPMKKADLIASMADILADRGRQHPQ
ncbi:hypothetical protein GCM10007939_26020 [Amylibacter marinus]|uniref:histidine kinase n=1 Tax=Amylibacter marinus TaxID=1475483 RepID=A0ABQ5VYG0_9RHOB|nr:ATP-binding protein [Amylibacter marinus]GLQ36318.1 hypothetical protein GCM10007939_26020 [Amylibacter marinus]